MATAVWSAVLWHFLTVVYLDTRNAGFAIHSRTAQWQINLEHCGCLYVYMLWKPNHLVLYVGYKNKQNSNTNVTQSHSPGSAFSTWFLRPGPQMAGTDCWQLQMRCYQMQSAPGVWSEIGPRCWHHEVGAASGKWLTQLLLSLAGSWYKWDHWW